MRTLAASMKASQSAMGTRSGRRVPCGPGSRPRWRAAPPGSRPSRSPARQWATQRRKVVLPQPGSPMTTRRGLARAARRGLSGRASGLRGAALGIAPAVGLAESPGGLELDIELLDGETVGLGPPGDQAADVDVGGIGPQVREVLAGVGGGRCGGLALGLWLGRGEVEAELSLRAAGLVAVDRPGALDPGAEQDPHPFGVGIQLDPLEGVGIAAGLVDAAGGQFQT